MSRRIVVVTAGLSQPSSTRLLADRIAAAVTAAVGARGESADVEVIELRDLATDLAITVATGGLPAPAVARAREQVSHADGLIAVTPVFTASYSGLFKMFFDVLDTDALNGMPTIVAATAGSARHSMVLDFAMRPLLTFLRAVVVPTGVFAATEDFGDGEAGAALGSRIRRAAEELAALVVGERTGVDGFTPASSPARPRSSGNSLRAPGTPFQDLLRAHMG
ncbi:MULTISPECIES: FMN reductase [Rhodococcus]|uniref:FMN reductase n=1 Tax=Rhodococcus aetherivorans TaxID=191292 RepID=A0AA46SAC3_9NOCA|nr:MULTISPECIES: FMN reductase [Rhodococcus]AKE92064.1 oxidoreductase [Rhodococcus aetherivorans]ANZ27676.1 oxidoreductase [Rhodococcus sp. WB1]MBC2590038.1 FMN reductase [Rhodococcus aetherivorans]PND50788.1 oxidoreductase [Rhodococcus sp. ENV425]QIX52795.1 FMN reductase [Rhodococcus sp. DMU1]